MKQKLLKSTFYLIFFSIIAKTLSFLVRIMLARFLNPEAMNLYALVSPTLVFVIALAQMGIPAALSKVIAQQQLSFKPMIASIIISIVNNLIVIALYLLLIPMMAKLILKQPQTEEILKSILPMIPLVTLSGLLKGYLQGKQEHVIACSSQLFEEIFRIGYLLFAFSKGGNDPIQSARIAMFSVAVGECGSALYMFLFCMRSCQVTLPFSLKIDKQIYQQLLSISIPMTSSRLIGSFSHFLEPIIIMSSLDDASALVESYGILNGYLMPLLTLPSFLTVTLGAFLLPAFTYQIAHHHEHKASQILWGLLSLSLVIGSGVGVICYFFPHQLLNLFYHQAIGAAELKKLSLPFILFATQPILSNALYALNKNKGSMVDTLIGSLLRLSIIYFLAEKLQKKTIYIAVTLSMLTTTFMHLFRVIKALASSKNTSHSSAIKR